MRLVIAGLNPEPWTSPQVSIGRKGGKHFPMFYSNEQMKNYKSALAQEVKHQLPEDFELLEEPISLVFYFWRRLDEYKSPQARRSRKHEADATNLQKATEDALQGTLFKNDKDVVSVTSYLMEQTHSTEPAVVIDVNTKPSLPVVMIDRETPIGNSQDPHSNEREEVAEEFFG